MVSRSMNPELHARDLERICEARGMYTTPSLNSVLLLNDLLLPSLPCLGAYINLRCIHLENNFLQSVLDLPTLPSLHSVFLRVCNEIRSCDHSYLE